MKKLLLQAARILTYATIVLLLSLNFKSFKTFKKNTNEKISTLSSTINNSEQKITTQDQNINDMNNRILASERAIERLLAQNTLEQTLGTEILEEFVSHLKIYDTYNQDKPIELIRIGKDFDGGYIVPKISLEKSDALIGYGIRDDISFEEAYSNLYNKESYGFDCDAKQLNIQNKLTHLIKECIATDKFLENTNALIDKSKISSFSQQLSNLSLKEKNIFIKMDIEGAEFEALPDVLKFSKNITGIAIEIHFWRDASDFKKAIELLKLIEQDFILVHLHASNCRNSGFYTKNSTGPISRTLEFSFINKNLVQKYQISKNQTHPSDMDMTICPTIEDLPFTINN